MVKQKLMTSPRIDLEVIARSLGNVVVGQCRTIVAMEAAKRGVLFGSPC